MGDIAGLRLLSDVSSGKVKVNIATVLHYQEDGSNLFGEHRILKEHIFFQEFFKISPCVSEEFEKVFITYTVSMSPFPQKIRTHLNSPFLYCEQYG